jgi:hypothetical protein
LDLDHRSLLTLYGVYLIIIGIREVHQTITGMAALISLIPFIVVVLVVLLALGVGAAVLFSQR